MADVMPGGEDPTSKGLEVDKHPKSSLPAMMLEQVNNYSVRKAMSLIRRYNA